MKTTADCKKFLVDFFRSTPDLITGLYDKPEADMVLKWSLNEKNWKRQSKCPVFGLSSSQLYNPVQVYEKGKSYPGGPHHHRGVPLSIQDEASERHFVLKGEYIRELAIKTLTSLYEDSGEDIPDFNSWKDSAIKEELVLSGIDEHEEEMTSVGFIVFETHDEKLYLGEYIGN
jgi:hypothetical protein